MKNYIFNILLALTTCSVMPAKSSDISMSSPREKSDTTELLNDFTDFYNKQAQNFPELDQLRQYVNFEDIAVSLLEVLIEDSYNNNLLAFCESAQLLIFFIQDSLEDIYTSGKIDEEEAIAYEADVRILEDLGYDESRFTRAPRPIFHLTESLSTKLRSIYISAQSCVYNHKLCFPQTAPAFKRRTIK